MRTESDRGRGQDRRTLSRAGVLWLLRQHHGANINERLITHLNRGHVHEIEPAGGGRWLLTAAITPRVGHGPTTATVTIPASTRETEQAERITDADPDQLTDAEFIAREDAWPHWPVLTLIGPDGRRATHLTSLDKPPKKYAKRWTDPVRHGWTPERR